MHLTRFVRCDLVDTASDPASEIVLIPANAPVDIVQSHNQDTDFDVEYDGQLWSVYNDDLWPRSVYPI